MSDPSAPAELPKNRRWFVVLAWVTLVLFTLFTGAITVFAIMIPQLREAGR